MCACSRCGKPVSYMTTVGACQCDIPEEIKKVCDNRCETCPLWCDECGECAMEIITDGTIMNEGDEVSIVIRRKYSVRTDNV